MSLLGNKELMKQVYEEYPREKEYPNTFYDGKHSCNHFIIYCNSDRDIVRCTLCGHEKDVGCDF